MKLLLAILTALTLTVVPFLSTAHAICLPIAPSVTCDDGPCFGIGYTEYTVTWADQSSCGCDEIEIYIESGCSGGWVLETTVDCDDTSYSVCLPSNTDHRFKIVYLLNDVQKVGDIISDCVDCP